MNDVVLFEEISTASGHRLGVATLNAEKALNALNGDMIRLLDARLSIWAQDDGIVAVLLRGAGNKAFCAGGDVRAMRDALVSDPEQQWPNPQAEAFFTAEYTLDYRIHTYTKPILLWGSGIVMGGGLGLMAGASHRVATASTRIAMPEISIGLYPDVAGSWFLQRMPARAGLFLGLTGAPLNARDALLCNLADHILPQDGWPQLLATLTASGWHADSTANHGQLTALLGELEAGNGDALADSNVSRCLPLIHQLMNKGSLAAVDQALRHTAFEDAWLAAAAKSYAAGSPSSAAVTWEIFRRARHLSLAEALRMELVLSLNFCAAPDFREGVRALLVDKDRNPQWSRPTLAAVDQHWVAQHFRSPWREQDHPLATLH
ncbi:enoyl-CoA hydratase/isomerase family protein [Vogesella indigofera]|uniref:enoyl-CoA hydratase/isomerase family protein n=1 Tax=Vogesella indigofera TaxID=45465 RepID=UPI00234F45D3|nr:enoyl-CoA hydratase/isomerase family protein [Vogesella indigofera]MDC7699914.1 enoyl-CoA hydratase/isomerase family protein [Vogesella indigofera]